MKQEITSWGEGGKPFQLIRWMFSRNKPYLPFLTKAPEFWPSKEG